MNYCRKIFSKKSPQPLWYLTLALMPGTGTSVKGEPPDSPFLKGVRGICTLPAPTGITALTQRSHLYHVAEKVLKDEGFHCCHAELVIFDLCLHAPKGYV